MKTFASALLFSLAVASPIEVRRVGITSNEFTAFGCRPIIMLFARGSTEVGNMGTICGPPTANGVSISHPNQRKFSPIPCRLGPCIESGVSRTMSPKPHRSFLLAQEAAQLDENLH